MRTVQTHEPAASGAPKGRRIWLWVVLGLVVVAVVLPVVAILAIQVLGSGAEQKFSPVGSSIG